MYRDFGLLIDGAWRPASDGKSLPISSGFGKTDRHQRHRHGAQSGFGREGGRLGIMDYLTPRYMRHHLVEHFNYPDLHPLCLQVLGHFDSDKSAAEK